MMKKTFLLLLAALLLAGCNRKQISIELFNPSSADRAVEMVEVLADSLGFTAEMVGEYALYDEAGKPVPYQVMYYGAELPQSIVFQAALPAQKKVAYTLKKGTPAVAEKKVFARFVPERKDDFAWENDYAAYRMYGPALAPENPSNGIDLWLKCTDELVVDSFYYREHELHLPYHVNYGKGLDCYKVAHTPGCGGVFPIISGVPQIGNQYDEWQLIEDGPLRVVFQLLYKEYPTQYGPLIGVYTVTVDAGVMLCKATLAFSDDHMLEQAMEADSAAIALGAGIILHEKTASDSIPVDMQMQYSDEHGWIAIAENAVADAGDAQGRNYVAVLMPGAKSHEQTADMLYVQKDYKLGMVEQYYFGGGWSEWKFPTDADWFEAVAQAAEQVHMPAIVKVEK